MNCPVDGCDYEAPTRQGLLGHLTGKRDEAHKGGWKEWDSKLDGEASGGSETGGSESPSEPVESGGGSHPADDVPPREERNTGSSGCPACGSDDWYSSDAVLGAYGGQLSEENRKVVKQHDRVCTECGEAYNA